MWKAYNAVSTKFTGYRFGFSEVGGLFYNMSVLTKNFKRSTIRRGVEMGQEAQVYANIWLELINELGSNDRKNV